MLSEDLMFMFITVSGSFEIEPRVSLSNTPPGIIARSLVLLLFVLDVGISTLYLITEGSDGSFRSIGVSIPQNSSSYLYFLSSVGSVKCGHCFLSLLK